MAKTYTAAGTVAAGDVYTAAAHNIIATDVNNMIVPPTVLVKRTSNLTSYTSLTPITWQAEDFDTDGMWSSGSNVNINTTGIYAISFVGRMTTATAVTLAETSCGGYSTPIALSRANDYRWTHSLISELTAGSTINASIEFAGGTTHSIDGTTVVTRLCLMWVGLKS